MSGPKIVRIVTREEILALCEGHLRRLEQAFEHWQAKAARLGVLDAEALAATRARHDRLRKLLHDDRLVSLQKEVPDEIAFLARDLAEREERAVEKAAQERQSRRNLIENAAALLRSLAATASRTDPGLVEALRSIASGRACPEANAIVARGFALLGPADAEDTLDDHQRELARALQVGRDRPGRWIAQDHVSREPRLDRIDQYIARLQTLHGEACAEPFLRRLELIERDSGGPRYGMLLDSLVVDLAASAAEWQARRARIAALRSLSVEWEALPGTSDSALPARVEACLAAPEPDMALVASLAQQCTEAIAQELHRRAAVARRRAVLDGLASLGYEVREGMETAWAESGSVVLRKAATPGYGIEVGGRAEAGRLQVRAVSTSGTRDSTRDRDIETIWCGEFTHLRSLLADRGSELTIEKALEIGEVPLKVVEADGSTGSDIVRTSSGQSS